MGEEWGGFMPPCHLKPQENTDYNVCNGKTSFKMFQIQFVWGFMLDFSIMQPLQLLPRANVLGWMLGQTLWDAPAKRNVRFQGRIPRIGWKIERTHTNRLFLKGTTTVGGTKLFAHINPLTFCCQWWLFWKWRIGGFHHEKEERELGNLISKYVDV